MYWSGNLELYVLHYGPVVVKHNFEACVFDPKHGSCAEVRRSSTYV